MIRFKYSTYITLALGGLSLIHFFLIRNKLFNIFKSFDVEKEYLVKWGEHNEYTPFRTKYILDFFEQIPKLTNSIKFILDSLKQNISQDDLKLVEYTLNDNELSLDSAGASSLDVRSTRYNSPSHIGSLDPEIEPISNFVFLTKLNYRVFFELNWNLLVENLNLENHCILEKLLAKKQHTWLLVKQVEAARMCTPETQYLYMVKLHNNRPSHSFFKRVLECISNKIFAELKSIYAETERDQFPDMGEFLESIFVFRKIKLEDEKLQVSTDPSEEASLINLFVTYLQDLINFAKNEYLGSYKNKNELNEDVSKKHRDIDNFCKFYISEVLKAISEKLESKNMCVLVCEPRKEFIRYYFTSWIRAAYFLNTVQNESPSNNVDYEFVTGSFQVLPFTPRDVTSL